MRLFKLPTFRPAVEAHQESGSIGSSLSIGFQVYLYKCWDPFVSPGCIIRLVFFGVSSLFQHVDLTTKYLRADFQVCFS